MTTDQINNARSTVGVLSEQPQNAGVVDSVANEARQIIAKARYDAFRMVTDARTDADSIIDEAKAEATELVSASEANDTIAGENADLVAVNAALRVEYNELVDLINESKELLDRLDVRLLDLATMPDTIPKVHEGSSVEVTAGPASEATPFVIDYSPAVAPPVKPSRDTTSARAESFYTRKSAKLPRIGREGGQQALDVVRSMRDRMRD
jgi:vacuolar-type H+-ATPase subunit H